MGTAGLNKLDREVETPLLPRGDDPSEGKEDREAGGAVLTLRLKGSDLMEPSEPPPVRVDWIEPLVEDKGEIVWSNSRSP